MSIYNDIFAIFTILNMFKNVQKKKTNKLIKFKRNVKKPLTHHICCHKYESSNSWSSKFLNFHWTMRDASFETIDSSWTKLSKRYYTQWPEYWLMDARDASPPPLICFRKYRHCVFANQPTLPLLLAEQWADFVPPGHCELNFARTRFIVSRIVEISTPRMEHAAFRNNWFHYRRFHSSLDRIFVIRIMGQRFILIDTGTWTWRRERERVALYTLFLEVWHLNNLS